MLPRPHPIAVLISSSCGRKDLLERHRLTKIKRRNQAMAKTMAKLQAQARKASGEKGAAAARVKPKAKARPKQAFNVNHFRAEDFRADALRTYAKHRALRMTKSPKRPLQ